MATKDSSTYGFVYVVKNTVNEKLYIGQTKRSVDKRWIDHCVEAKGKRYSRPLHCAMRKYGIDKFSIEVIGTAGSDAELNALERAMIEQHQTQSPNGYNLTSGGDGVASPSKETRDRMSAAKKNKPLTELQLAHLRQMQAAIRGVKFSDDHRQKIGDGLRNPSAETRRKMGDAKQGKSPNRGRVTPDEVRRKISIALAGRKMKESQRAKLIGHEVTEKTRSKMSESAKHRPPISEETREKMRRSLERRSAQMRGGFLGKKHSQETKQKMAIASTGRVKSAETRAKISAAHKGKPSTHVGMKRSEETRKRMREAAIKRNGETHRWSDEHKARPNPNIGTKRTEEARLKMSEAARHRPPISEATREKLRAALASRGAEMRQGLRGKHHSEETRRKMSAAIKASWEARRAGKRETTKVALEQTAT